MQQVIGSIASASFAIPELALGIISPEISILIAAFVLLIMAPSKMGRALAPAVSLAGLAVSLYFVMTSWNMQASAYFDMVLCDNYCLFAKVIFLITCSLAVLLSRSYLIRNGIDRTEYYAMMLFSTAGMMFMVSSTNLMVIFLGLEIMSLPLYVLAGFLKNNLKSTESAAKYFFMGAFASAFFLYGIALVFGGSGTADLKQIAMVTQIIGSKGQLYMTIGAAMILIGFAFKIAAFPFHMWVPDVYQGAPTPVTAFFSVAPKAAGVITLIRIFTVGLGDSFDTFEPLFWMLALFTMTAGNILAVMQDDVKRMLAYSSIAHAGYLLIALTAGSEATSAALFYLLSYCFFNMGAFALVIIIEMKTPGKNSFESYKGLAKRNPWLAVFLALFMFSLAGFPPTAGFLGKFYLFSSAITAGHVWLVIFAVLNSLVSVFYYLRPIKAAFFEEADVSDSADSSDSADTSRLAVSPMVAIAIIITTFGTLGLGLFPSYFLDLARSSAAMML